MASSFCECSSCRNVDASLATARLSEGHLAVHLGDTYPIGNIEIFYEGQNVADACIEVYPGNPGWVIIFEQEGDLLHRRRLEGNVSLAIDN